MYLYYPPKAPRGILGTLYHNYSVHQRNVVACDTASKIVSWDFPWAIPFATAIAVRLLRLCEAELTVLVSSISSMSVKMRYENTVLEQL